MPGRCCQHQSSSYVPQMLTPHWGLCMSYMWAKSNFFVLQLYYNTVNSLGVQFFAKKQQIKNICMWCVSASITGECSACKRRYLQLSCSKDLEPSPARPLGTNCSSAERSKATDRKLLPHQCCSLSVPVPGESKNIFC